ncbi:MAG: hypothetical protein RLY71_2080 [Pseudomonadota bacterium]
MGKLVSIHAHHIPGGRLATRWLIGQGSPSFQSTPTIFQAGDG